MQKMTRRILMLCLLIGLGLAPLRGRAETAYPPHLANGSELLTFCAKKRSDYQTACLGYIAGVSDAMIDNLIRDRSVPFKACIPRTVLAGKRAAIVIRWMTAHISYLRRPAATLIVHALSEAYPCKK